MHSLESLQATDLPTPEPPSDNPLLEAAGITCEVPQTQDNGSDVTIRPQFGPALVPPNTASGKIVYTDQLEHTARRFSAWLPPIQCTLSGHQCMMIIQG